MRERDNKQIHMKTETCKLYSAKDHQNRFI